MRVPAGTSVQVLPLSREYFQVAPDSRLLNSTVPLLVIVSVPLLPVSLDRDNCGTATRVSSVKVRLDSLPKLPLASVWRTATVLRPSPDTVKLLPVPVVQVPEPTLYCQVAPASGWTVTWPSEVVTLAVLS